MSDRWCPPRRGGTAMSVFITMLLSGGAAPADPTGPEEEKP